MDRKKVPVWIGIGCRFGPENALANGPAISEADVVDVLVRNAEARLVSVIAQRVYMECKFNFAPSLERSGLAQIKTPELLKEPLIRALKQQAQALSERFDAVKIEKLVLDVSADCKTAIKERDVLSILRIFEGKQTVRAICRLAGCSDPGGMISAASRHLSIDNFPELKLLRQNLLGLL